MSIVKKSLASLILLASMFTSANACSRFTYTGPDYTVVTGRSMDWVEQLETDLWAIPAGISKVGSKEPNSVKWTSKYGSLIISGYNMATVDGINSKGLVANLLYLATSDYGKQKPERQNISIFTWAQYVLDNYATVEEAVEDFGKDKFNMTASLLPNGSYPAVHLAITDPSGNNAIFEYIDGKLIVYEGKQYTVMTNEPQFDKQLTLNDYWQSLNGVFLPGTGEPEDRFVRASYYLSVAPKTAHEQTSIATVFSIIRNVSVPITAKSSDRPNVAPTLWRSVADLKRKIYYFESTNRPNIFWTDLSDLNLAKGAQVKKLPLSHHEVYAGDVSRYFVESKPFFTIAQNPQ